MCTQKRIYHIKLMLSRNTVSCGNCKQLSQLLSSQKYPLVPFRFDALKTIPCIPYVELDSFQRHDNPVMASLNGGNVSFVP